MAEKHLSKTDWSMAAPLHSVSRLWSKIRDRLEGLQFYFMVTFYLEQELTLVGNLSLKKSKFENFSVVFRGGFSSGSSTKSVDWQATCWIVRSSAWRVCWQHIQLHFRKCTLFTFCFKKKKKKAKSTMKLLTPLLCFPFSYGYQMEEVFLSTVNVYVSFA